MGNRLLFIFFALFCFDSYAQFDGTSIKIPNPQQNTIRTLKYVYRNKDNKPHVVNLTGFADSSSPCHIVKAAAIPILPGKTLEIFANCKFTKSGYFNRKLATAHINAGTKNSTADLSFSAQVAENLSNRIVNNKNHTTCIDIDHNKGKILPQLPVLDQDGVGSCYAHAAATMYEYELRKSNKNQTVSPIDIGLVYKLFDLKNKNSINSGVPITALKRINASGVATRECIDKVIKEESKRNNLTTENYINLIQNIYKELDSLKKSQKPSEDLQKVCTSYKISDDELNRLVKMLDTTLIDYLQEEFVKCSNDRKLSKNAVKGKYVQKIYGKKEDLKATLDDLLNHNSLPVISFCAQIIQGKLNHDGLDAKGKPLGNGQCGTHAILVTGRKIMDGQCHYLLRNSWGADWKRNDLTCACQSSAGYYQDCTKAPATAKNKKYVGCWVKESSLWNNTYEVSGIK